MRRAHVVVERLTDDPDDVVVHVFADRAKAVRCAEWINARSGEIGLSAELQSVPVETSFRRWKAAAAEELFGAVEGDLMNRGAL